MAQRSTTALVVAAGIATMVLVTSARGPGEPTAEGRAPTPTELLPAVEGAFALESYAPAETARLVISNRARGITLQIFRSGPERRITRSNVTMNGVPVSARAAIGSSGR